MADPWVARTLPFLTSAAWRNLSNSGRRFVERLEIEHMQHGGTENGNLVVTFDDFERAGINRKLIRSALDEAVALGFVKISRPGRSGAPGLGIAHRYQLTHVVCRNRVLDESGKPMQTDEWKTVADDATAMARIKAAQKATAAKRQAIAIRKKQKSQLPKGTETRAQREPVA